MKNLMATKLLATSTLALSLLLAPGAALAGDADDAFSKAKQQHFGTAAADGAGANPTATPDAMVSYFTSPPAAGVAVASRRHLDLDVKFNFDSDELGVEGISQLDVAGKALNRPQLKEHRFVLAGHTDDRGDTEYNLDLSLRRAEAARQYLISEYGVEGDRLEAAGLGSAEPRSTDGTPEARRMNRRVVLEMLPQ